MPDRARIPRPFRINPDGSTTASTPAVARTSWGGISSAGAITVPGSGDWTVTHLGTGRYQFNNSAWPAGVAPIAMPLAAGANVQVCLTSSSKGQFTLDTFNSSTLAHVDAALFFIADY